MIILFLTAVPALRGHEQAGMKPFSLISEWADSFMSTRFYAVVLLSCLGIFILSAVVNGILESSETFDLNAVDPKINMAMNIFYFVLFLGIGFSIVPLMVKLFIFMQVKIGNGEFFLVKFIREHEQGFVYSVWGIFIVGLMIALPSAIREGFFK